MDHERNSAILCGCIIYEDEPKSPYPIITAIKFDKSLEIISELVLDNSILKTASVIKRIDNSNTFLVGCYQDLAVISFEENQLILKNYIEKIHSGKFFLYNFRYCL